MTARRRSDPLVEDRHRGGVLRNDGAAYRLAGVLDGLASVV
jgi:hypothetical protein